MDGDPRPQFPAFDRVVLHGIGEPRLTREIFDIVAYGTVSATSAFGPDTPPEACRGCGWLWSL